MKKIVVTGTQNGANKTFTLAEAGVAGGAILFVQNNLVLKRVDLIAGAATINQCAITSTTVTLHTAPAAPDRLFAFIQSAANKGLKQVSLKGTQDSTNTIFGLSEAPPAGSHVIFTKNGLLQEEVAAAPGANQFTISGTTTTHGTAPASSDVLQAWIEETSPVYMTSLTLSGVKNGRNGTFVGTMGTLAGYQPVTLTIRNGLILKLTIETPVAGQYALTPKPGQIEVLLIPPAAADTLDVFPVGLIVALEMPSSLLNFQDLTRRGIMMTAGQCDDPEMRLCLDDAMRTLFATETFSFSKGDGRLSVTPAKTTGTVTVTNGSTIVQGSGTSVSLDDVGMIFLFNMPYRVIDTFPDKQLWVIDLPYSGTTESAKAYTLCRHRYPLDNDIVRLFYVGGQDFTLMERPLDFFDSLDPQRSSTGDPLYYAYCPQTPNGITQIELWPIPLTYYGLRYVGLKRGYLSSASQVLGDFATILLKKGLVAAFSLVATKKARDGKVQEASFWIGQSDRTQREAEELLNRFKGLDLMRFGLDLDAANLGSIFADDPGLDLGGW